MLPHQIRRFIGGKHPEHHHAAATTEAVVGHVDPTVLVVDVNVRTEASVDRAFVTSIRERGMIQPVLAIRDSSGMLHVRAAPRPRRTGG